LVHLATSDSLGLCTWLLGRAPAFHISQKPES